MADKKECDRCKILAPFGELKGWATITVRDIGGATPTATELCPTCREAVARYTREAPVREYPYRPSDDGGMK